MMILLTILALLPLALEGILLVLLIERNHPVLSWMERVALGFLLGGALSAYLIFFASYSLGLSLTLLPMALTHGAIIALLGLAFFFRVRRIEPSSLLPLSRITQKKAPWISFLLAWFAVWTIVKVIFGGYDLLLTPTYFNDTYASWNMRAKALYTEKSLMLDRPTDDEFYFGGRVPSYPLTVHLSKVWIANVAGEWNESAVNSIHFVWFLCLLVLFFAALKRELNSSFAMFGTYLLVSLPLLLVHGVSAYTDVLMAAHLFAALYTFYRWIMTREKPERSVWLFLFAISTSLMLFVKNEALLIFLPPIGFLFFLVAVRRGDRKSIVQWLAVTAAVALPWTLFKWLYDLTFGNATEVSSFTLSPTPGVAFAVEGDLLYTGSYLLFFPLFLLLLFLGWNRWRKSPLNILVSFFLLVFVGEYCIYWLTPLATEAIRHTGFGRGMVHLLPLGVFISVLILQKLFSREPTPTSP